MSSPRRPVVRAIANASRTRFGVMPVGVNLGPVGSGDGFVVAVRRRGASVLQLRRFGIVGRLFARPDRPLLRRGACRRKAMSSRETSTNASASARPTRAIIHVTPPERGRWAGAPSTLWAPLARRSRGAGATAEPVGRDAEVGSRGRWRGLLREHVRPAKGWLEPGQKRERAGTGDPGRRQAVGTLEPPDRSFGEHAITAVDRAGRTPVSRQSALKRTHHVVPAGLIARPRA